MGTFLANLWAFIRPYRPRFFLGALLGVVAGLKEPLLVLSIYLAFTVVFQDQVAMGRLEQTLEELSEAAPRLGGWLSDLLAQMQGEPSVLLAFAVISIIPITMLVGGGANYLYTYLMQWVSVRAIGDLRTKLFDHLLNLPSGLQQRHGTGELISRVSNDIGTLSSIVGPTLVSVVRDPITLFVLVGYLLSNEQQREMTLWSALILPICVVPIIIYTRKVRRSSESAQNEIASVFERMHEGLTGARVVKAYNLEDAMVDDFRNRVRRYNSQQMRVIRSSEISGPMIEFFGTVGVSILMAVIATGSLGQTVPSFFAFIISIQIIYTKIKVLVRLSNRVVQARGASQRVFDLLDLESDLPEPQQPVAIDAHNADIQFDRVTFGYSDEKLLTDFNLTIKAGQLVALVGQSGSGKTTLTNLLLRFYDPQAGAVRIGGTDIRDTNSKDLRAQIAVVTQDNILFNDSISRNIELGRPGATEEEIRMAARHAHAEKFIEEKEGGYNMVVGEKGSSLSGGQKQRIAIARAIVKNAPILILDEATSALDTESERAVQAALDELMEGRTTICIAHRLSTIQHADVIVVMDRGQIVEQGTHAELLKRNGFYKKLHDMQFRDA